MFKLILLLSMFLNTLFALEIEEKIKFENLLVHSHIYIDKSNVLTIKEIEQQQFIKNHQKSLGFGYSPNFTVWIKFKLENKSDKKIDKIIEYANPLTTDVTFFDPQSNQIHKDGLTHISPNRESLNPIFAITLEPYSSKTFYIKAHSHITTLIVSINLWDKKSFYIDEIKHQVILAMFFGAMGIIILYNLLIYWGTKEISYLYYVLFFTSVVVHQLLYRGILSLYILPPNLINIVVELSSFLVAIIAFLLALFTKNILELKQYPKINRLLTFYLIIFPILVIFLYWIEIYQYKNIFSVLLIIFLFFIILHAHFKKNRQSYFLSVGWSLIITSGFFMYISSLGLFDIFSYIPYYTEISIIIESLILSLLLADKIKQLNREKIILQENLINYQKEEKKKLFIMVEEKTKALKVSLEEKELLLKELNHRVKNSIQTIVSFLRLQMDEIEEKSTQQILMNIENRILSISHLYALLYTKDNICFVNTDNYFKLLVHDIETSYAMSHINIEINSEINISSEYAIYCGFILNEAITNSLQHAFIGQKKGLVSVNLKKEKNLYRLTLCDDGLGYNQDVEGDSLGLIIIETLVKTQLQGSLKIDVNDGVKLEIEWKDTE